ncbi:MAG: hypothetical protein Q4A15_10150, partial [Prevotellaceae bacterium]|nr:hypothetical protein [Prevotellaceae bacterium]
LRRCSCLGLSWEEKAVEPLRAFFCPAFFQPHRVPAERNAEILLAALDLVVFCKFLAMVIG